MACETATQSEGTIEKAVIGHLYPPSHPERCQTTGEILDLIASGIYGSLTFNDGTRDIQTWVASNGDAEKLFRQVPSYPEGYYPYGAMKITLVLRHDGHFTKDQYRKQKEVTYRWKRNPISSG